MGWYFAAALYALGWVSVLTLDDWPKGRPARVAIVISLWPAVMLFAVVAGTGEWLLGKFCRTLGE